MSGAGCQTDNSVITMRNDTCHVATVLGTQEGVVRTTEYRAACALFKVAAVTQSPSQRLPSGEASPALPELTFQRQQELKCLMQNLLSLKGWQLI